MNPAAVKTDFLKSFLDDKYSPDLAETIYGERAKTYPVGRVGEVADTSNAIAFLANDETASFLTGILLPVDGGIMTGSV